jgi:hypothetical protein
MGLTSTALSAFGRLAWVLSLVTEVFFYRTVCTQKNAIKFNSQWNFGRKMQTWSLDISTSEHCDASKGWHCSRHKEQTKCMNGYCNVSCGREQQILFYFILYDRFQVGGPGHMMWYNNNDLGTRGLQNKKTVRRFGRAQLVSMSASLQ